MPAATNSSSEAPFLDPPGPRVEPLAQLAEVTADVVREAEVDQRELLGSAPLDLLERAVPTLDVDVGRRRRRQHRPARLDPYSGCVARVERRAVEVADVVGGMAGRGEDLETRDAVGRDADVALGYGCKLAPELIERVPVQLARAPLEPDGSPRCGAPISETQHRQLRMLAHEHSGRTRVVEVDVRQQQPLARRRARSPRSASPAFRAATHDVGPQSKRDSPPDVSRRYAPTVRAAPRWNRSIGCSAIAK